MLSAGSSGMTGTTGSKPLFVPPTTANVIEFPCSCTVLGLQAGSAVTSGASRQAAVNSTCLVVGAISLQKHVHRRLTAAFSDGTWTAASRTLVTAGVRVVATCCPPTDKARARIQDTANPMV